MGKDHERVLKMIDRLTQLGVKVSKTKSRIEVFNSLKSYQDLADHVKA
ncbi:MULTISPECIES: Lmo0850 family protein [Bacillaceae]|nr:MULTISPECIES: Lmo0850 family protein [Bacillus]